MQQTTCDSYRLRKNETCTQWGNRPCSDYRAIPYVSEEEKEQWRTAGTYRNTYQGEYWGLGF